MFFHCRVNLSGYKDKKKARNVVILHSNYKLMDIQKILANLNLKKLSPMQENAVALIRNNINAVVLAPTGSGKTLAFLLPLIETINTESDQLQALILSPTRELALQTLNVLKAMKTDCRALCCYGGRPAMDEHRQIVGTKPHIIIGTPGRLNDHISKQNFDTATIKTLVVDEFDKMFELNFQDEVEQLLESVPQRQRCILVSATDMKEIPEFVAFRHRQPAVLNYLDKHNATAQGITHHVVHSPQKDKLETLHQLLCTIGEQQAVVFVNYREAVERTGQYLVAQGHSVSMFHGGLEQQDRESALSLFRNGSANVLVSTDLSARGIDVPTLQNAIHYHLPLNREAYIHRCGRTGRWEEEGKSYIILGPEEKMPDFNVEFNPMELQAPFAAPAKPQWVTIYIGRGKKDKLSKGDIVGFFCKIGGMKGQDIGMIDIRERFSYVAIRKSVSNTVLRNIAGEKIKKMSTRIEQIKIKRHNLNIKR